MNKLSSGNKDQSSIHDSFVTDWEFKKKLKKKKNDRTIWFEHQTITLIKLHLMNSTIISAQNHCCAICKYKMNDSMNLINSPGN